MARRKNTKRIDPRWFMDEKTDVMVIKEEKHDFDAAGSLIEENFDTAGNLIEENFEEPLDEAVFGGLGLALLGKLFVTLFKMLQSKDELADLNATIQQSGVPDGAKEISAKALDLMDTVQRNAPALEKVAAATGAGGNLNPLNWKANALIWLAKKAVQSTGGKAEPDQQDREASE